MTPGKSLKPLAFAIMAVGIILGVILALEMRRSPSTAASKSATPSAAEVTPADLHAFGTAPISASGDMQRINEALDDLSSSKDAETSSRILAKLRAYLLTLPKAAASRLIEQFLDQKKDGATKLEFAIEKNGFLSGAPTLRVFLMDLLEKVDPQAAAQYALQILSTPGSPDEWAISLRNYALGGDASATQSLLEEKIQEMLSNGAWRANPSVGYLEAFDAAVYTHDTALTPNLSHLIGDNRNPAVAHAAFLALDRLVLSDPAAVLTQLQSQPDLMAGHEQTRADYFARADASDSRQKALLEGYLLDPNRTQQELNAFAGIYPNQNYMISNNLLTQSDTPTYTQVVARDREALTTVQGWMGDPRFQALQPQLQTLNNRLTTLLQQAPTAQQGN